MPPPYPVYAPDAVCIVASESRRGWRGGCIPWAWVTAPTEARLRLRAQHVLDLYFGLLVSEVETLVRQGLAKRYRREHANATALRGRLLVTEHVRRNAVRRERFYVEHAVYDRRHLAHRLLAGALALVEQQAGAAALVARAARAREGLGAQAPLPRVTAAHFDGLGLGRRLPRQLAPYRRALEIARLLLLRVHPGMQRGRHRVLALLFDMNALWERYLAAALRRALRGTDWTLQVEPRRRFWTADDSHLNLKPDLVLTHARTGACVVLDAKWKVLAPGEAPRPDDLRQVFAYAHLWRASRVGLVVPGIGSGVAEGVFVRTGGEEAGRAGVVVRVGVGAAGTAADVEDVARRLGAG